MREGRVAFQRLTEQREIDAVGHHADLGRREAARDEIAAQALADGDDGIRAAHDFILQRASQPVAQRAFAAGAVADRGVFPEGANFVDDRQAKLAPRPDGGEAAKRGRVGVEDIRAPFARDGFDAASQRADFLPFRQPRRARRLARCAVKREAIVQFELCPGERRGVAQAGEAAHFMPQPFLRLEDRARAEGVAALQRQRVIEDMENPGHVRRHATAGLNAASTEFAY